MSPALLYAPHTVVHYADIPTSCGRRLDTQLANRYAPRNRAFTSLIWSLGMRRAEDEAEGCAPAPDGGWWVWRTWVVSWRLYGKET